MHAAGRAILIRHADVRVNIFSPSSVSLTCTRSPRSPRRRRGGDRNRCEERSIFYRVDFYLLFIKIVPFKE